MTSDFLSVARFHILRLRLLLLAVLLSGALTLLCAWLAEQYLTERIAIIGSFAGFVLAHNPGIAFSITFPPLLQHLLIAAALVAVIIVALRSNQTRLSAVGFGFIIGGALGNVIDRIPDGLVTDFLQVGTFSIFNIADSFITVGVGLLLLHSFFQRHTTT